jgi:hypothetical protein
MSRARNFYRVTFIRLEPEAFIVQMRVNARLCLPRGTGRQKPDELLSLSKVCFFPTFDFNFKLYTQTEPVTYEDFNNSTMRG